jgi:hypothetical protein
MEESKKAFAELLQSYARYVLDKSEDLKSFMNLCFSIEKWSRQLNYDQVQTLNELRKVFPIYLVAYDRPPFKNGEFIWRGKKCKYNLVFIVAASSSAIKNQEFIIKECAKYVLDFNDEEALEQNMKNLLDAGYIVINKNTDLDSFAKDNPKNKFVKW